MQRIIGYFDGSIVVSAGEALFSELPVSYQLGQNYPNPFNPSTIIEYTLPAIANVSLSVYNLLGEVVSTLVNERKASGTYRVEWNAESVTSGVYFYRLQTEQYTEVKKMLLIR